MNEDKLKNFIAEKNLFDKMRNGTITQKEKFVLQKYLDLNKIRTFRQFVLSMGYAIDWQWFHFFMMKKIDEMLISNHSKRYIFELPPRHCKTLLLGELLMAYYFGRYPDKICIYGTANEERAASEISNIRTIINSKEYTQLFPNAKVKSGVEDISEIDKSIRKNKKDTDYILANVNATRGKIIAVGRHSMVTGLASHLSIADDLYKGMGEANSPVIREKVSRWFHSEFINRLDKLSIDSTAHAILFFTRWNSADLCGELIDSQLREDRAWFEEWEKRTGKKALQWELFSFQAIKTERDYKLTHSPIPGVVEASQADPREIGEPLWPKYEPEYYKIRSQSPDDFTAQYQQTPLNEEGLLFNRTHFVPYTSLPSPPAQVIICVDPSFKNTESSDFTGIVVLGMVGPHVKLLDFHEFRADYVELRRRVTSILLSTPQYHALVVEEAANGAALISDLRQTFPRIVAFNPQSRSKKEKAQLTLPLFDAGNFHVPTPSQMPKIQTFLQEFLSFDGRIGGKDNLVDATVIGLLYYASTRGALPASAIRHVENRFLSRLKVLPSGRHAEKPFFPSHRRKLLF